MINSNYYSVEIETVREGPLAGVLGPHKELSGSYLLLTDAKEWADKVITNKHVLAVRIILNKWVGEVVYEERKKEGAA